MARKNAPSKKQTNKKSTSPSKTFWIILLISTVISLGVFLKASQLGTPASVSTPQNNSAQIKTALQQEIPTMSGVKSFEVVDLKVDGDFARATIKPLDVQTDNAWVFLQNKAGVWKVVWGPGTDIPQQDPIFKIIPKSLQY